MSSSGKAMMGTGEAEGDNRAMAATELALNNPLIDEYTLQGAKGLLINITGGSDLTLFEVDAAVNKIRAEVDPEAELIFGAIKDEDMNGKIRVSIVATSLKGSMNLYESKPIFNVVNGTSSKNNSFPDNLFAKNNVDQNVVSSISGANALKLDESYEIKNSEEQNALIESFESNEENKIANDELIKKNDNDEVPSGVSIESASYMENNIKIGNTDYQEKKYEEENLDEDFTPKLFSDEKNQVDTETRDQDENSVSEQLFDQDTNEDEDFEIPLFKKTKILMINPNIDENSIQPLEYSHFPVMLSEIIQIIIPSKGGLFVDCTFGGGGYSKAILKFPKTKLISIDRDSTVMPAAKKLEKKFQDRFKFYQLKFSELKSITKDKADAIIFDLGLSSIQLNNLKRGFSFKSNDKLDMTMGLTDISAQEAINNLSEKQLKLIIKVLGEEKEASRIAKNIVIARSQKKLLELMN